MSIYVKENEKERKVLMHEFYRMYEQMEKRRRMGKRLYFSVYGNNVIEVWEYKKGKRSNICRVKEDSETGCYQKALEIMKLYDKIF